MTDVAAAAARRRDEAREDAAAYHKAVLAGRNERSAEIESKWGLAGLPPQHVSVGLLGAADGVAPLDAIAKWRRLRRA